MWNALLWFVITAIHNTITMCIVLSSTFIVVPSLWSHIHTLGSVIMICWWLAAQWQ